MSKIQQFLNTLRDFHHSVGWMLKLRNDLAAVTAQQNQLQQAFIDPPELRDRVGGIVDELQPAWTEVRERRTAVKDALVMPGHPIDGVSPMEWRHQLLCEVDEAAEVVGGPYADSPKLAVTEPGREKLVSLLAHLTTRCRQVENMVAGTANEAKPLQPAGDDKPLLTQLREAYAQHSRAHMAVLVLLPPYSGSIKLQFSVLSPEEVDDGLSRSRWLGGVVLNDGSRVTFVLRYAKGDDEAADRFVELATAGGIQIPRTQLSRLHIHREESAAGTWFQMLVCMCPEYITNNTGNFRAPDPTKAFQLTNPWGASLRAWEAFAGSENLLPGPDQKSGDYNLAMVSDVFISHASEDKDGVARELAAQLRGMGYVVWYDEYVLKLGDSLRRSIDRGLAQCRFGIVLLSKRFFAKSWPQQELDGLVAREMSEKIKRVIPVWHEITLQEIAAHSPTLADRLGVTTSSGLDRVVAQIVEAIGPPASEGANNDVKPTSSGTSYGTVASSVAWKNAKQWRRLVRSATREFHTRIIAIRKDVDRQQATRAVLASACERVVVALEPVIGLAIEAIRADEIDREELATISAALLDVPEWNPAGVIAVSKLHEVAPFVLHHVVGACAIHEEDRDAAIQLLVQPMPDRSGGKPTPLWATYPFMGCGESFLNDCLNSWMLLERLHSSLPALRGAITNAADYVEDLRAYACLASSLEMSQFVSTNVEGAAALRPGLRMDVHPMFLFHANNGIEIDRIARRAVPTRKITQLVADAYGVPVAKLQQSWPAWVRFLIDDRLHDPLRPGFRSTHLFLSGSPAPLP